MKDTTVEQQKKGARWWKWVTLALLIILMTAGMLERPGRAAASFQETDSFTSFEGAPLSGPRGVAIDNSGKVYVAENEKYRIVIYNPDGSEYGKIEDVIYESGHAAILGHPGALTIKNDILYMVNGSAVHRFDMNDNYKPVSEDIQVSYLVGSGVYGIALDSGGAIYTASYYDMMKVSPSGQPSVYFELFIDDNTHRAEDVAIDKEDNLYVLSGGSYVHKFDKNKNLLDSRHYGGNTITSMDYHDGVLYLAISNNSSVGFQKVSATDGRILAEHIYPEYEDALDSITVHPVTKDIYLSYRYGGVKVYKDIGTTVTATASSYAVQYGDSVTFDISVSANSGIGMPTGSIALMDGDVKLADINLAGGTASYTTTTLSGGTRSITAVYQGTGDYAGSTSAPMVIEVDRLASSVTVQTSQSNTVWGEAGTFTATVSGVGPVGETPTGTVTFSNGTTVLGTGALDGGQAVISNGDLAVGTHTVTAQYSGDAVFDPSDGTVQQTVDKAASAVTPYSTNISVFGETVTFTASVAVTAPGAGSSTGDVTFKTGSTTLGVSPLVASWATLDVSTLEVGTHPITVEYSGDGSVVGSSSTFNLTVEKANSSVELTSSKNVSSFGETVTFQAAVTVEAPGSGTPTGDVVFKNGTDSLGTVALSGGIATLDVSSLTSGAHTITAEYSGDSSFEPDSGMVTQTVNKIDTTTVGSANPGTVVFGETVAFTATVSSPSGTPGGTVTFRTGSTVLGARELVHGEAVLSGDDLLEVGTHTITVEYGGSASFTGSTSTFQQTVDRAETTTSVASAQGASVYGETVTLTATVTVTTPGAGTPTGAVTFKNGATTLGTVSLSGGAATLEVIDFAVGAHTITAEYNGDSSFLGSSDTVSQTVNKADTNTSVTTSKSASVYGETVTLTATVTVETPGVGTPTGAVMFKNGATTLGTVSLSGSAAILDVSDLPVGAHTITAEYSGDGSFAVGTGLVTQTVGKIASTTVLSASPTTGVYGEAAAFTATVSPASAGGGTPEGTVTFRIGSAVLGVEELEAGVAVLIGIDDLEVGAHTITAEYSGDSSFLGSSGTASQTVNKAHTSTSVVGETVTLTAAVTVEVPGAGKPTGAVTFVNGAETLGIATVSGGIAMLDVSDLEVGTHAIEASYSGDGSLHASDSTLQQTVNKADVRVYVSSSQAVSAYGEKVSFTAVVMVEPPGGGSPTGVVTFRNGAAVLGSAPLSGGEASIEIDELPVGSHTITAEYSGESSFRAGSGTVTQELGKTGSVLDVTVSKAVIDYGDSISFTATVSAAVYGKGTPTGTVTVRLGTASIGSGSLDSGGVWTLHTDTLPVGSHLLDVHYSGDGSYGTSTQPVAVTVNKAGSTVDAVISTNTSVYRQAVSVTAKVEAVAPGSGMPSGEVTLRNGAEVIGTGRLFEGEAIIETDELPVDNYSLEVAYSGDEFFDASVSSPLLITVDKAQTTSSVEANGTTIAAGSPITLTARIHAVASGAGTPTGHVTFSDQHGEIGTVVIDAADNGVAELTLPQGFGAGTYEISARYDGDGHFHDSQSASIDLVVNDPPSTPSEPSEPSTPSTPSTPSPTETPGPDALEPIENAEGMIVIPPGGSGTVRLGELIQVDIPAEMSDQEVSMTIEELTANVAPIQVQQTLLSSVYEILANLEGTFEKEITISFEFDTSKLAFNQTAVIFYYDEENREWVEVGGTVDGNVVSVSVDHLTKFAVFAVEKKQAEEPPLESVFFFDTTGHWGENAIRRAAELGLVNGYPDGGFRPDAPISRAEFLVMLTGAVPIQGTIDSQTVFTDDARIGAWARTAVYASQQAGIVSGYNDGTFRPEAPISRAELAVMVARAHGLETASAVTTDFADDSSIPQWAKGAVEAVREAGILSGRDDDEFAPQANATRAEAATILMRVLEGFRAKS